ncbi:MAG: hypothetical protein ACRD4O_13640, partial [Bryobacteraceae bacterium]
NLDVVPVLQTVTMGGANETAASSGSQQQPAQQPSQEQQADKPSMSDAVGGALAGHFGFGHRKHRKQQDQAQQEQPQPAQNSNSSAGTLLEMNTESANFSSNPVDASQFVIPAGFRQVESDTRRMAH